MYEMIVPGKYPVQVPPHLAGTVAVSLGRRLAWRILAIIIYGTLDVLLTFAPFYLLVIYRMSRDAFNTLNIVTGVMAFAWLGFVVIRLVRTGATPLMSLTGVRWVRVDTGAPAGWAGLGKLLLQSVIGTLTFGIGSIIICFASMDEINRTWFDRRTRPIQDARHPAAPGAGAAGGPAVERDGLRRCLPPSCPIRAVRTAVRAAVRAVVRAARASHPGVRSDARAVGKRRLRPGADAAHAGLRTGIRVGGHGAVLGLHWLDPVVEIGLRCGCQRTRGDRAAAVLLAVLVHLFDERAGA